MYDKSFEENNQAGGTRIYEYSRYKVLILRKKEDTFIKIAGLYSLRKNI